MRIFVKIDEKNIQEVVDFYFTTLIDIFNSGKYYPKVLSELPKIKKALYSKIYSEISSMKGQKIAIDPTLKLSNKSSKFIKIAAIPGEEYIIGKAIDELMKGLGGDDSGLIGKFEETFGKFEFLKPLFEWGKKFTKGVVSELTDINLIKDLILLDKAFEVGKGKEKFSPSSIQWLLEADGPRGINNSYVSQGAYELPSKSLYEDYERTKKEHPEQFRNKYKLQDDPGLKPFETKPTIFFDDTKKEDNKSATKFQPLHKNIKTKSPSTEASNNKYVKVAQSVSSTSNEVEAIKKLLPKWVIDSNFSVSPIAQEIRQVSANTQLDNRMKEQEYDRIIKSYEKSLEGLHKYISDLSKE